ncbi:MAG TPA: DUF2851 family protein [Thermomicrobiaceae bacterium]|nr:DUF2851 family protein [Thermomicrobiaceae bacterium]
MGDVPELLLARIWHAQWLTDRLRTLSGESVRVVFRGVWTHGLGPDFAGACLDVDGALVEGDVEVHRHSSAWYAHGHDRDPAYDAVVLHVVLDDDLGVPVRRRDGRPIPCLLLRPYLLGSLDAFDPSPELRPLGAIGFAHCAPDVARTRPDLIARTWELAGDARLAARVATIAQALSGRPPAQVLYALLLDALGYSRNRDGMRAVGERLPLDQLDARLSAQAPAERQLRAAGLLLGVAGFLPLSPREADAAGITPAEVLGVEQRWRVHGAAWHQISLPPTTWSLTRQRPAAHPLRRLLAMASLLARLQVGLLEDLCALVTEVDPYRVLLEWLAAGNPWLGRGHAHEIVVNVVVPFTLAYAGEHDEEGLAAAAGRLWDRLPAGAGNAEARRTAEQICGPYPVRVRSARAAQGLLHIRRTGCAAMRCFECPVARLALRLGDPAGPDLPAPASAG